MSSKVLTKIFTSKIALWKTQKLHFTSTKKLHTLTKEVPVKEVEINLQSGLRIAGKLWGKESQRPILALHGWQDNAGTWDPLAPILAKGCSILAIDFPGHGLSDWFPQGMQYFAWMWPSLILQLKEHYGWEKLTLLGHSMGSIACFRFACIFSQYVDAYVGIDSLIYDDYDINSVIDKYPSQMGKFIKLQKMLQNEPPSYPWEDIKKIWHLGTYKSVSLESAEYLMERGLKPSKADPTKFYFSRDPRLKYVLFNPEDKKFVEALSQRLNCPTLYIKGDDSKYSTDPFSLKMRETLVDTNDLFECAFAPGTHHLHLNDPNSVAPLIITFLKKYKLYDETVAGSGTQSI